jgi:hypothetical protein
MGLTLYYTGFYTHFSFVLFIISLMLPFTSPIKFFLLLNSIIVGFIGNLIHIKEFDTFFEYYRENEPTLTDEEINYRINLGNFISHTLPLFLSLVLLPFCTTQIKTKKDVIKFTIWEFGLFLIWALLPFRNNIVQEKVDKSYPNTAFTMAMTLTFCIFFFALLLFLGRGINSIDD